jgi:serine/threonine protein phosphatase PrpC
LRRISPCRSESKDQDRAGVIIDGGIFMAVVCDGTTQSMCSAEAAELIASDPGAVWDGRLPALIDELRQKREALIAESTTSEPDLSTFLSRAFARIMEDARQRSYQTTFVAARMLTLPDSNHVLLEAKGCGDSAVLVFDSGGTLLHTNLPIIDGASGFGHLSPLTDVIPDHFGADVALFREEVDRTSQIVLCSDGFYDSFPSPSDLFHWLNEHSATLEGDGAAVILDELHDCLDRRVGDDDISFIWLRPCAEPDLEPEPRAGDLRSSSRTRFSAAFARLLRIIFELGALPGAGGIVG